MAAQGQIYNATAAATVIPSSPSSPSNSSMSNSNNISALIA